MEVAGVAITMEALIVAEAREEAVSVVEAASAEVEVLAEAVADKDTPLLHRQEENDNR